MAGKPYLVLNYTQKVEVEGHGTYEFTITNIMNPFTMRIVPTSPTLFNPLMLLAKKEPLNRQNNIYQD